MSINRENVTWQSADGTWNLGFFTADVIGPDEEWDVEYDFDTFEWVSVGHPTADRADASWRGANPGGGSIVDHNADTAERCARYDAMAADLRARVQAERAADRAAGRR